LSSGHEIVPPPTQVPTLVGVDISHYQKRIEWNLVAEKGEVDFVFVKASEGHDYQDSLFSRNWEALGRHGITRGAYHFFRAYGCGEEQARLFLSTVEMCPGDLRPVLDIERLDGISPEIMIQEAKIWCDIIEETLHCKPIIYSGQHFYDRFLSPHFDQYPLWIARYSNSEPYLSDCKPWDIWQFSNQGCIDGICTRVDMNIFPGTVETLERLRWYPVENEPVVGENKVFAAP
jgi:lysozyme